MSQHSTHQMRGFGQVPSLSAQVEPPPLTEQEVRSLEYLHSLSSQKRDAAQSAGLAGLKMKARDRAFWEIEALAQQATMLYPASCAPDFAMLSNELVGYADCIRLRHENPLMPEEVGLASALYDLQAYATRCAAILADLDAWVSGIKACRELVEDELRAANPYDSESQIRAWASRRLRPLVLLQTQAVPVLVRARTTLLGLQIAKECANQIRDLMSQQRLIGQPP